MNLTSYERVRRYLANQNGTILTNSKANQRDIEIWIKAVSNQIEKKFLKRELEIKERTEYYDTGYDQKEYFLKAYPILSISSVCVDYDGLYDGNEVEILDDDRTVGSDNSSVVLLSSERPYERGLRVIYTGGLAYDGVQSTYALESVSGTWVVDNFCIGQDSGAVGIVNTVGDDELLIHVLNGSYEVGETLKCHINENASDTSSISAILQSKTIEALCESYPEFSCAAEMQIRYMMYNKNNFEFQSYQKDATAMRKQEQLSTRSGLIEPAEDILQQHKNIVL